MAFTRDKIQSIIYGKSGTSPATIETTLPNVKLKIINRPNDPEFDLLMHRLIDERKFLYKGKMMDVAPGTVISFETRAHPNTLTNVKLNKQPTKGKKIHLGLYNLHECYNMEVIKDEKRLSGKSLLEQYDPEQDVIYLTEVLPENEWQRLLVHIKENYPDKQFNFVLAEGAGIENVMEKDPDARQNPESQVFISNDPDYLVTQLAQDEHLHDPLIVDITPDMLFKDLIFEKTQSAPDANGNVKFYFLVKPS